METLDFENYLMIKFKTEQMNLEKLKTRTQNSSQKRIQKNLQLQVYIRICV